MADITYKELSDAIAVQAMKDPNFRKELVANPVATFEKYTGQPVGAKVYVHENSATETHFVLPPAVAEGELSDDDLEKVAGGEFFIGMAIIGIAGVAVGAAGIANDQTKARHGW